MLLTGTEEGVYRVTGVPDGGETAVQQTLETPRVERVRQFDAVEGVFAGAEAGLFHSTDGRAWTDLQVPANPVWAVTVSPTGEYLYAGTVPASVYVTSLPAGEIVPQNLDWRELEGFHDLPDREEWGVPRHDDMARVRDLCMHPESPTRLVAGVEPAGVHVSRDGGETWEARTDGVHEDVHSLDVVSPDEYLAATGRGLYRTDDAGRSWERLDEGVEQRYFRTVFAYGGTVYASGACVPPSNYWETPAASPALFACREGSSLDRIDSPCPDEVVVGWTGTAERLLGITHRGTILGMQGDTWEIVGDLPTSETIPGCYYNMTWYDASGS